MGIFRSVEKEKKESVVLFFSEITTGPCLDGRVEFESPLYLKVEFRNAKVDLEIGLIMRLHYWYFI